ncbi:MAG: MgtC/SapB family protein [Firmicutes bacterium]|nr:MgtC/SapB family protein [Bacillota bacterium]
MGDDLSYMTLWNLAITLGLGLLVGLERERAGKEVGLRTFAFASLLGFLSWGLGAPFALASLAFVAVIVVVFNINALRKESGVESTTSVALFLMTVVGMLVAQGQLFLPVAVTILVLLLLSWKEELVLFTHHLQRNEMHAAFTLLLLSFVILPVLPDGPVDPYNLFNLRSVWTMVVLISAISFGNYILLKLYGARGVVFTGFFGGLVNSQATAIALAEKARDGDPAVEDLAFRGIMLAKTAAFLRNGLTLAIFAPAALPAGVLPVGLMMMVTLFLALRGRGREGVEPPAIEVESPFSLASALQFGLLFAVITVLGALAQHVAGSFGFYAVSLAGGLVSSASTAATAANLVALGRIEPVVAGSGVVLSSLASALVILPLVWRSSRRPLLVRRVAIALTLVIVAIVVGIALNPYFLSQYMAVDAWFRSR